MITLCIRYTLDTSKLAEFEAYARSVAAPIDPFSSACRRRSASEGLAESPHLADDPPLGLRDWLDR